MNIKEISIDGYKNLKDIKINPCECINIFCGENGHGKTNLLEGINLFCGKKEFHNFKDIRLIGFDEELAVMRIEFNDEQRDIKSEIVMGDKKKFSVNRVEINKLSEFSNYLESVTFSPEDMNIIDGGSKERRKFLDNAITQLRPDYLKYLKDYNKILKQKNTLLKEYKKNNDFDIWDIQLAKLGVIITILRNDYIKKIRPICEEIYKGIAKGKEKLRIFYNSTVFEGDVDEKYSEEKVKLYFEALVRKREEDKERKYTSVGVQKDDIIFKIDGMEAKDYGSRGQRRSCVISLKLSEARLLKEIKKRNPIILLDDIMSELDTKRQEYILNNIRKNQVFITCCDINNTLKLQNGTVFHVLEGRIKKYGKKGKRSEVND